MKQTDAVGTAGGKATVETTVAGSGALTVERLSLADMQAARLEAAVPVSALRALCETWMRRDGRWCTFDVPARELAALCDAQERKP